MVIGEDVAPVIGLSVSFVAVAAEIVSNTVILEIFARFLFSRNFAYVKFGL